jgi:hypothetical protein
MSIVRLPSNDAGAMPYASLPTLTPWPGVTDASLTALASAMEPRP